MESSSRRPCGVSAARQAKSPTRAQPAQKTAQPRIGCNHAQLTVALGQFDVIDAYDLSAVNIDNLLVEHVIQEQHGRVLQSEVGFEFTAHQLECAFRHAKRPDIVPAHPA